MHVSGDAARRRGRIQVPGLHDPRVPELLLTFKGPAGDGEPTPEAILWPLFTGEIPIKEQCDGLTAELFERSALPAHATQLLDSLPEDDAGVSR